MKKILVLLMICSSLVFGETTYVAKIVMDEYGNVVEAENMDQTHPMASITKMVTALIVMDRERKGEFSYDEKVEVSYKAATVGGSSSGLRRGDKVSVEDLMKALIVRSGNDAAYTLAEFIAGSEEDFVKLMNAKADELGLKNTKFHTCTGLPTNMTGKELDESSAYDVAKLSLDVTSYPKYMEWASMEKIVIKDGRLSYDNRNRLISEVDGVDGLKTGHHSDARYNIAVSAKREDMRLIFVILGSADENIRDRETKEIIEDIYNRYEKIKIASKGDFVLTSDIKNSKEKEMGLYLDKDIYAVVEKNDLNSLKKTAYLLEGVEAPVQSGAEIGNLKIRYRGNEVASSALVSDKSFEELSLFGKIIRVISFGNI